MINEVDLAYLARLFDGEGSFVINRVIYKWKKTPFFYGQAYICNTNLELINWLKSRFNGRAHITHKKNPKHKQVYKFNFLLRGRIKLLKAVLPFLIIKKKQAELVLELWKHIFRFRRRPGFYILPSKEIEARQRLYNKIKVLNRRGINVTDYD